jgi:hypothetical protein
MDLNENPPPPLSELVNRAEAALADCNHTIAAACEMVVGIGVPRDAARTVLLDYSQKYQRSWTQQEIINELDKAYVQVKQKNGQGPDRSSHKLNIVEESTGDMGDGDRDHCGTQHCEGTGFFNRHTKERAEIIEGLAREGQLVAFAGPYGIGKSPSLADITIHVLNGIPWCGRNVIKRPVIILDFESSGPMYKNNVKNICRRLGVSVPRIPEDCEVYLEHDAPDEPSTAELLRVLESKPEDKFSFLQKAMDRKPDALIIIDPVELLFRLDTSKKVHILSLYHKLKFLLSQHPSAAILLTFNLRKKDKRSLKVIDLLCNPRDWLEEVCGSLDILNRSDVRLGIDVCKEDIRVINGIRRGEEMHPILIRPIGDPPDNLAGFELCNLQGSDQEFAFTPEQRAYWQKLPSTFRFDEVADKLVPRSSLFRLISRAKSLGVLTNEQGRYRKKI